MSRDGSEFSDEDRFEEPESPAEYVPASQSDLDFVIPDGAVDISTKKDGSLYKLILKEGTGDIYPSDGSILSVHYTGTLTDGSVFDSSIPRGDYFSFTLGQGQVIKAWDVGMATMKKDEKCKLICKPSYGYGKKGSPPKIPGNSMLIFEVELFFWKEEDLSIEKDESILKTLISKGQSYNNPTDDAEVEVHIRGTHEGRVFEERDVSFVIGDGVEKGICAGLEVALKKFKKGEKSRITLAPCQAFGEQGNSELGVPPDAVVVYDVVLLNFEKAKEMWEMDSAEKLEQAAILKSKAGDYVKAGRIERASALYNKIIKFLENEGSGLSEEQMKKRNDLFYTAKLNLAMCLLKQEKFVEVISACTDAVAIVPTSVKGFFRRGKAHLELRNYELASADFSKCLEFESDNKPAKNSLLVAKYKLREELKKEKNMYTKIFSSMFAGSETVDPAKEVKTDVEIAEPEPEPIAT